MLFTFDEIEEIVFISIFYYWGNVRDHQFLFIGGYKINTTVLYYFFLKNTTTTKNHIEDEDKLSYKIVLRPSW